MRSRQYGRGPAAGVRGWAGLWTWCAAVVAFYGWPWLLPFPANAAVFVLWLVAVTAFSSRYSRKALPRRRPRAVPPPEPRKREPLRPEVKSAVWARDGGRCRRCRIHDDACMAVHGEHLQFDHIIPWSKGGSDEEENIQLLCPPDNRAKGASLVWRTEW
jgi:HNH endonuclease